MSSRIHLPRRTFLRGLGTLLALPHLESLVAATGAAAGNASAVAAPVRMAFVYVPNGADMVNWTPSETGTDFVLPRTLEPLAPVRSDVMVLSGLTQDKARANGDGAGDHARASATFLTSRQARKTQGADIRVGVSGYVLSGPMGGPGAFQVPVRVSVRRDSDGQIVQSKTYRIAASITADQAQAPFSVVTEPLTVPFTRTEANMDYSIFVGFDGTPEKPQKPAPRQRKN